MPIDRAQPSEVLELLPEWWEHSEALIGVSESQRLEFKRTVYRLQEEGERLEYAKDVSAMANGGGGIIVLGIESTRDTTLDIDVSSSVPGVLPAAVDVDAMQSVARDWVYPPKRDQNITKWVSPDGQALVSIEVPPTEESVYPLLIRGAEVGVRVRRTYFSVAVRHGDRVDWLLPDEIHRRLQAVEEGAARVPQNRIASTEVTAAAAEELEEVRSLYSDSDWPIFVLQAWPTALTRVERMHDEDGAHGLLLNPPTLRRGGFNLDWSHDGIDPPRLRGEGGIARTVGDREGVWILPNGTTTFFGTSGPNLLGWGMEQYHRATESINPTALGELTYEFVRLHKAIVDPWNQGGSNIFRIAILGRGTLRLTDGHRPTGASFLHELELTGDLVEDVGPTPQEESAEQIAGTILARFYGRFGMGATAIPYVDRESGVFDPDILLRLDGPGL